MDYEWVILGHMGHVCWVMYESTMWVICGPYESYMGQTWVTWVMKGFTWIMYGSRMGHEWVIHGS